MAKLEINPELIAQAKNGSLSAFEQILFASEKIIFNYLYRLCGHRQTAEDLTQETFIKLYQNLAKIDETKSFKSWLFTIATNVAKDFWRKKYHKQEFFVESAEELETIDPNPAYYRLEIEENQEQINRSLAKIKPEYAAVLLLYYQQEYSYQEISDSLKIPINTVKTYLFRAKKALKDQLVYGGKS